MFCGGATKDLTGAAGLGYSEDRFIGKERIAVDIEVLTPPAGERAALWRTFLARSGLEAAEDVEQTVLVWDGETLAATGSRRGDLLLCIAADPARRGEGLLAAVLTALRQEAARAGRQRLFLYTKPENEGLFAPLCFYPVARGTEAVLMEDRKGGVRAFLGALPADPPASGAVGAAVMHCDPFTRGHRSLIERAAAECGRLYVFVLSEDRGRFPAGDRRRLVEAGTADLPNVRVLPTGPYLISTATFPTYFLKDRDWAGTVQCQLDMEIFTRYFVPHFGITRRYVGTEPLSPLTARYNEALLAALPRRGVEVRVLPRLERDGVPVSASAVRAALDRGDWETVRALVPPVTFAYLRERADSAAPDLR